MQSVLIIANYKNLIKDKEVIVYSKHVAKQVLVRLKLEKIL